MLFVKNFFSIYKHTFFFSYSDLCLISLVIFKHSFCCVHQKNCTNNFRFTASVNIQNSTCFSWPVMPIIILDVISAYRCLLSLYDTHLASVQSIPLKTKMLLLTVLRLPKSYTASGKNLQFSHHKHTMAIWILSSHEKEVNIWITNCNGFTNKEHYQLRTIHPDHHTSHCALCTLHSPMYCSQGKTEVILWFQTTFSVDINFHPQSHLYKRINF